MLYDNGLDYRYDDSYDRICVAVKHYGENTHPVFAAVTCPDKHRIRINTYNGMFNVQPEGKEELLSLLERVNANSEYLNLDVDSKTAAIVSTCVLDEKTPDARIYILPILMEQARILDEYYDDMVSTHGKKMPRVFLDYMRYYELVKFAWIPINVIVKVGDKLAIIHEQSKNIENEF